MQKLKQNNETMQKWTEKTEIKKLNVKLGAEQAKNGKIGKKKTETQMQMKTPTLWCSDN